jgi:hypothetical protein
MAETIQDNLTPSYFSNEAHAEWTAGERLFYEAVGKVYKGQEGSFELGMALEDAGGLRVCEARAYGIELGAARMAKQWREHLDNPADRIRAIRAHLSQLMAALDDLEGEIR